MAQRLRWILPDKRAVMKTAQLRLKISDLGCNAVNSHFHAWWLRQRAHEVLSEGGPESCRDAENAAIHSGSTRSLEQTYRVGSIGTL